MAQSEIERVFRALPPAAQRELQLFVDYLQHKYRNESKQQVARLGGLWADIEFDVSDEELNNIRSKGLRTTFRPATMQE
jgi:hypothetical protein